MILGFLSDAHGNAEALLVGLARLHREGAERVFFLGDAVGYLPGATAVGTLVELRIPCVKGSHETMLLKPPRRTGNEAVLRLAETAAEMEPRLITEVSSWPRTRRIETVLGDVVLAHGSPTGDEFTYLYRDFDPASLNGLDATAAFVGHTHLPFVRRMGSLTVVNVGSCGLPRDHGGLGSACLYNDKTGEVRIVRFDITEATEAALRRCGPIADEVRGVFARRREVLKDTVRGP